MKIGMLGCGTVGSGVYEIINTSEYLKSIFQIKKILVRNPNKYQMYKDVITTDINEILDDSDIDVIVEVMGGHDPAYEAMIRALNNKKHVVTANKEVLSKHLSELIDLAHKNDRFILFEATVAGGIPVINAILNNKKVNRINEVNGILNGSTNYILSLIQLDHVGYDDAIKSAFEMGFLEADPTDDLYGIDMVRKIAILSSISYLGNISIDKIYRYPLSGLSDDFVDYVNEQGYMLKYCAQSKVFGNKVAIRIEPVIFDSHEILASINQEINIVQVYGKNTGPLNFTGPGAGKYPTANSIVTDLIQAYESRGYVDYKNEYDYDVVSNDLFIDKYIIVPDGSIDDIYIDHIDNGFIYTKEIDGKTLKELQKNIKFYARING